MIFQVKISLLEIKPAIWRRVLVPGDVSLHHFHETIQKAMGWENRHLYKFWIDADEYALPDPEYRGKIKSSEVVSLARFVPKAGVRFFYTYDFGDNWEHEVLIEKILEPEKGQRYPVCVEGKRACPPEDCGSVPGYKDLLKAISNKKHPEHKSMMSWLGGHFDPEAVSVERVNKALKSKRRG